MSADVFKAGMCYVLNEYACWTNIQTLVDDLYYLHDWDKQECFGNFLWILSYKDKAGIFQLPNTPAEYWQMLSSSYKLALAYTMSTNFS